MIRVSLRERTARSLIAVVIPGSMALLAACSGAPEAPKATATSATSATSASTGATAAASATTAAPAKASASASPSATTSASASATAAAGTGAAAATPAAPPKAAPPAPASVTSVTVPIANFAYGPASGTAPLVVRWTNNDTVDHDVILADGSSPVIAPGASFERRFDRPGTYAYSCSFHPFMTGTVTVR